MPLAGCKHLQLVAGLQLVQSNPSRAIGPGFQFPQQCRTPFPLARKGQENLDARCPFVGQHVLGKYKGFAARTLDQDLDVAANQQSRGPLVARLDHHSPDPGPFHLDLDFLG